MKFGIAIRQIMELNEPKQLLTLNVWIRLNWFDCRLQWNPREFGGIDSLIVPIKGVWVPDITLYDNAGSVIRNMNNQYVIFYFTGNIDYNYQSKLVSLCRMDTKYFPFDTQICPLKFGSWVYGGFQIDVTNRSETADLTRFIVDGEWDMLEAPVKRHVNKYNCCLHSFPDVTFYVTMKRKPLFYVLNLLFPFIVIAAVAVLGFLLPPDSGEKVSLEITVLLSLAVFLAIVSANLPHTSENVPFIGIYFCLGIVLVSLSTVLSVVVLNFHFKGQHCKPVPRRERVVFLKYLTTLLMMNDSTTSSLPHSTLESNHINYQGNNCLVNQEEASFNPETWPTQLPSNIDNNLQESDPQTEPTQSSQLSPLMGVLREQLRELRKLNTVYYVRARHETMTSELMFLAKVLDRLFLDIFTTLHVSVTVAVLLKAGV